MYGTSEKDPLSPPSVRREGHGAIYFGPSLAGVEIRGPSVTIVFG